MSKQSAINDVAAALGTQPAWLSAVINGESGGNPQAVNPHNGYAGLISFGPAAAQDLNFTDQNDLIAKFPDFESQLRGPVYQFLSKHAPLDSWIKLTMSVLYPDYVNKTDPNTAFPTGAVAGFNTIQDYITYVQQTGPLALGIMGGGSVFWFLLAAVGSFAIAKGYEYFKKQFPRGGII